MERGRRRRSRPHRHPALLAPPRHRTPGFRIGRSVRFWRTEVLHWLENQSNDPRDLPLRLAAVGVEGHDETMAGVERRTDRRAGALATAAPSASRSSSRLAPASSLTHGDTSGGSDKSWRASRSATTASGGPATATTPARSTHATSTGRSTRSGGSTRSRRWSSRAPTSTRRPARRRSTLGSLSGRRGRSGRR